MARIPFDMVEDILSRLPVKPLKRFRCVAKPWRSLIDRDRFVKLHLNMSLKTNSHRHLIVLGNKEVYNVDVDNNDRVSVEATVIKPPFCNGVVSISNSGNIFLVNSGENLFLWNPFTKEYKKLPRLGNLNSPVPVGCSVSIACGGFAWDSRNDDYKVVTLEEHRDIFSRNWVSSQAYIYGSKSNSWRQTVKFTYSIVNWQAEANGAFHTLISDVTPANQRPVPAKIMAFSFVDEKHYEVKLPSLGDTGKSDVLRMKLHKLGGCLSMSYTSKSGITIWVMKEYGVRNSWTKLLSIPMKLTMAELNHNQIKPLVYTKESHKVLLIFDYKTFFWQDLRNQSIDSVSVKNLPRHINNVEACVESLVSFHSKQVHKKVHGQDKEKDKKTGKKRDGFLATGFKLML